MYISEKKQSCLRSITLLLPQETRGKEKKEKVKPKGNKRKIQNNNREEINQLKHRKIEEINKSKS